MSSWLVHSLLPLVVHVFMFAKDLSFGLRFLKFQIDWFATTGEGEPFTSPSRSHYRLRYVFKSLSLEHFPLQNLKWSFKWTQLARLLIRIRARSSYLRLLAFNLHFHFTSLFYRRNMRKVMKDPLFCFFVLWSQLLHVVIAASLSCDGINMALSSVWSSRVEQEQEIGIESEKLKSDMCNRESSLKSDWLPTIYRSK